LHALHISELPSEQYYNVQGHEELYYNSPHTTDKTALDIPVVSNEAYGHKPQDNVQDYDEPYYESPDTMDNTAVDIRIPVVSNEAYGHSQDKTALVIPVVRIPNEAYYEIEARNIESASVDGIVTQGNMAYGHNPQEQNRPSTDEYDYIYTS